MGVIDRARCESAFHAALRACDPAALVSRANAALPIASPIVALAVGKAALAMARGAPPVVRGLAIANADDGRPLPVGWRKLIARHPVPDASSVAAGMAALSLVESANERDTLLALISGGASSLIEVPAPDVTLDDLVTRTSQVMASGATIQELNRVRAELSALKGGKLAARSRVPIVTLVISDVVGDDPRVIGSGPTIRDGDRVDVIATIDRFGIEVERALAEAGVDAHRLHDPLVGDVHEVAKALGHERGTFVAWGEPTTRLPNNPGVGGRAQQLALELARVLRGRDRCAFVAGSDGIDGTSRAAGAFIDGTTWDAIATAGISPDDALARCDASTALDAVGALFVTGPTGVNHADVVIVG